MQSSWPEDREPRGIANALPDLGRRCRARRWTLEIESDLRSDQGNRTHRLGLSLCNQATDIPAQ